MDQEVSMHVLVRSEKPTDLATIEQVTIAAFDGKWYSDQTEHLVVNRLREAGAMSVSLVAEFDRKVIGHIAFSVVTINGEDKGWYGLGPVSVSPEFQKQGIGSKLIQEGLSVLKEKGAKGCVLEGDPGYYQRFGFTNHPDLIYEGTPDPKYFMALPFYDTVPEGKVEFHKAFYANVK
jgi:putative acetyltransferase